METIYDGNIDEFISKGNRILSFGASWCADCLPFGWRLGFIEKIAREAEINEQELRFGKVNLDGHSKGPAPVREIKRAEGPYSEFRDGFNGTSEGWLKKLPITYLLRDGDIIDSFLVQDVPTNKSLAGRINEVFRYELKTRKLQENVDYVSGAVVRLW